ncbi:MAG: HAD family hydrolase, partial [Gammaproteobacteria bacterium]|nr:HAD family hydrolase [Gammaproteobacteria bacterium]
KPNPEIFNLAMQKANVEPQACIYVGDNYYDDAVGSSEAGMRALILNRFGNLGVEEIDDAPIIQNLAQIKDHL